MVDLEDRLRETLRRKAVSVPPHREVPKGLIQRALRQIARNMLGVLMAIAIVAVGAVTGVQALNNPSRRVPVTSPTLPATTPVPASTSACVSGDLSGTSRLMASSFTRREGFLLVTNEGTVACTLQGRAAVRILDVAAAPIDVVRKAVDPWWKVNGKADPGPLVALQPGQIAQLRIVWTSWCGAKDVPSTWEVALPGGGGTVRFALDTGHDIPSCSGQQQSTLRVGPFEPYTPQT